jgi:hypothetical protein
MTAWSPLLRWFALRLLLLLATVLLAPGCGYSTYNIPPAELQRLTRLPPSQRGNHVRVYTEGLVPAVTPNPPVVAVPPAPPPQPMPPPPEAAATSELADSPVPVEEIVVVEPTEPAVVLDITPPRFVPMPPPRVRPALPRLPPPVAVRPSLPRPSPGHISVPRAIPRVPVSAVHGSAPVVHAGGGHLGGPSGFHHVGGGGGGGGNAAIGVLVGAVVLIGLIAIIASASQPVPFDGWIHTSPEHPLHLTYKSGVEREIRLCDLKPADIVSVQSAVIYDTDGTVNRLESATSALQKPEPKIPG